MNIASGIKSLFTKPGVNHKETVSREFMDNESNRVKEKIREAAREYLPHGHKHLESWVFMFSTSQNIGTGLNEIDMASFKVLARDFDGKEYGMSPEVRQSFLGNISEHLLGLIGAKKIEVKPKTMEQVVDDVSDAQKRL